MYLIGIRRDDTQSHAREILSLTIFCSGAYQTSVILLFAYTTRVPIPADGMDRISEEIRSFSDSSLFTGPFSGQFKAYICYLDASVAVQQRDDEFVHEAVKYFDRRVVTIPQDTLANSYA